MPRTVFWSWQSDLPNQTNRGFIKRALEAAIEEAGGTADIEERLELDHDTKGQPGLVSIPDTILRKIDECELFVADLTPIARSESGKFVANPNVLIELGYAKKSIGSERIILIWNCAYEGCLPELLPFDLRHRRGPVSYRLPAEHDDDLRRDERQRLAKNLRSILAQYSPRISTPSPPPVFEEARHDDPSAWFEANEVLRVAAGTSFGDDLLRHPENRRGYARIVPLAGRPGISPELDGDGDAVLPLGRTNGRSWGRTRGGHIAYSVTEREGQSVLAQTSTMIFRASGQIWGVDHSFFWIDERGTVRLATNYIIHQYHAFLKHHLSLLKRMGVAGPLKLEFGINDLSNSFWPRDRYDFTDRGALEDRWKFESTLENAEPSQSVDCSRSIMGSLFEIFAKPVYDEDFFQEMLRNWRA